MTRLLGMCAVLLAGKAMILQAAAVSQTHSHKSIVRKSPYSEEKKETNVTAANKVDIDVYYETRCPGCLLFLNQTLEPLWRQKKYSDIFNVNLYTYGNGMTVPAANISEGYKFWHPESTAEGWNSVQICQHGSDECLGNLVQVCAKNLTDHEKHMNLVFCMTANTIAGYGVEKATYECMDQAGIDKTKVRDCVTSPEGNNLLTAVGDKTHNLKGRTGTPWVIVGGEHVANEVLMNSTLLLQSVCKQASNVPVPCSPFHDAPDSSSQQPAEPADPDFTVLKDMNEEDLLKVSQV
jgi:hypothetical protein